MFNYRLFKHSTTLGSFVAIHLAHYNSEGELESTSLKPVTVVASLEDGNKVAVNELRQLLKQMEEALEKPIL